MAAALMFTAETTTAQTKKGAFEIGVDNGLMFTSSSDLKKDGEVIIEGTSTSLFDVPLLFWHLGYFVSDRISIEIHPHLETE